MLTTPVLLAIAGYAALFTVMLVLCARPLFGILQQEGYLCGDALGWYMKKKNMLRRRYRLLSLCTVLVTALLGLSFCFLGVYAEIIEAAGYIGMCVLFVFSFRKALKVPVKVTKRYVRLAICTAVLLFAAMYGCGIGLYCGSEKIGHILARALRMAPVGLFPMLLFLFAAAANCVMKVYEVPRSRYFIKKAQMTLEESKCVKVGITGSFAKTSVKLIASRLLETKFNVKATPASYNTPIGIAKFVNEEGADCDIFLAEMGARHVGDIAELCELVKPTVGVVTGVCAQHLETFKTVENISAEKGKLARAVQKAVLGSSACGMREDALKEGTDFAAEDVTLFADKTQFTLRMGEKRAAVETKLLGRHAAEDIAIAAALCSLLGMTFEEIVSAISAVSPVPHRLERSVSSGVVILDDSYNSNPEGAKNAVEILKLCNGKKFVVTPGLVELGEMEEEANTALGRELAGLDEVILVGETLILPVRNGYLEMGGKEESLHIVPDLQSAQEQLALLLKSGDSVLFLNDLPDKY